MTKPTKGLMRGYTIPIDSETQYKYLKLLVENHGFRVSEYKYTRFDPTTFVVPASGEICYVTTWPVGSSVTYEWYTRTFRPIPGSIKTSIPPTFVVNNNTTSSIPSGSIVFSSSSTTGRNSYYIQSDPGYTFGNSEPTTPSEYIENRPKGCGCGCIVWNNFSKELEMVGTGIHHRDCDNKSANRDTVDLKNKHKTGF